jgi:Mce-associated membrane protein
VAVPPAPDDGSGVTENSSTHDQAPGPVPAAGFRLVLLIVLSAVLVLSIGTFVGLAVTGESNPTGIFDGSEDDRDEADRQAVMSQAQQFILRVNTYGPDLLAEDGTMPDYREQVLEVITDKFAASFEESVPAAESTVSQAGFSRTAEVFGAGVSVIDSDSATALVAGSFTNSYPVDPEDLEGERQDDLPLPFRVRVELVKVGGEWLVDGFSPVTGEGEEPTVDPSGTPSGEATTPSEEATQ